MKKLLTTSFLGLFVLMGTTLTASANSYKYHQYLKSNNSYYSPGYSSYYSNYYNNRSNTSRYGYSSQASSPYVNRYTRSYTQPTTTYRYPNYTTSTRSINRSNNRSVKSYYTPSYNRYSRNATTRTSIPRPISPVYQAGLTLSANPISLNADDDLSDGDVRIFELGVQNTASSSNSTFQEAVVLNSITFQIIDGQGSASDFSQFELDIDGEDYSFDRNGYLTFDFDDQLRLASGESQSMTVKLGLEDPSNFSLLSGSMRVRISGFDAYRELSGDKVKTQISGNSTSNYIAFNRRTGGGSIGNYSDSSQNYQSVNVLGKNLGTGETSYVLTLRMAASADDFLVEELTVRNTFGSNVDEIIDEARLVNLHTGEVLDTTRFVGGKANFDLNPKFYIRRNNLGSLGVQVVVDDNFNTPTENRIKLTLGVNDIEVYGVGAGNNVPDSRKNIDVESDTFTITRGGGAASGVSFSGSQPNFVATGNLSEVARFRVYNGGRSEISVARFTVEAGVSGVDFDGGSLTDDDLRLQSFYNGRANNNYNFTTQVLGNNQVRFQADREIYVSPGEVEEFVIMAALENDTSVDDDYITFRLLGDNSSTFGTLSSLRGTSNNFLWSDHSGRPHTGSSRDWYNGYSFPGLPTNTFVNRN